MPVIVRRCNRQVTCSPSPSNDRSESAIAANPLDPYNMVGASKKFTDPHTYAFSLAAYATFDGGQSWTEAAALPLLNHNDFDVGGQQWTGDSWIGISDPTVTWDDIGNAYLIGLAFTASTVEYGLVGLGSYKSTDGGRTWSGPRIVHLAVGDDKQWVCGDGNPASPHHGNLYCVWDGPGGLNFARSLDHGASWVGAGGGPSGSVLGAMYFGEVNVDSAGNVYVFGNGTDKNGAAILFVKSIDGGNTWSAPATVASPITEVPYQLPGGKFRNETMPSGCCGTGNNVFVAWPDYRDGVARIYYARSTNGGNSWQSAASGDPLLGAADASGPDQHDFMPQMVATPSGEIGCAFYEWGPKGGATKLIDVVLAVSTDNGHTFPNRATVTDHPWDPTVDEVWAHSDSTVTFIGDYFGLEASRLGFFPFWTDTRTGVQEMFTSRIAVSSADVFIRDSSSDTGTVPSPGFHWEAPDLIVRWQPDGNTPSTFIDQGIQNPVLNDHYVYARVKNNGPATARNVTVAVTVGNWPQYAGMPGTEFRYPQDWYKGDWVGAGINANRKWLGETPSQNINNGNTVIVGPITWHMADIPAEGTWHPCLLADVRADNNDTAGGADGCDIDGDPDPCSFGSYFWGNNNACQRNLSYYPAPKERRAQIVFPFVVGSVWSKAKFHEIVVEKGPHLADIPMTLHVEPLRQTPPGDHGSHCSELVFVDKGHVVVRAGGGEVGELLAAPGTVWRCGDCGEQTMGATKTNNAWQLTKRRASVGFATPPGQLWRATLAFTSPPTLGHGSYVRVFQRNDRHVITGSVTLELK